MTARGFEEASERIRLRIALRLPHWTFAIAAALFALALAPAWLRQHGEGIAAMALFAFFRRLCHQQAERSLMLFGAPIAVCARCLGAYAGAALGGLVRLEHRFAIRLLGLALASNLVDIAAESLGLHGNIPLSRLLIGGTLGIAAGTLLNGRRIRRPVASIDNTRSGLR